MFIKQSTDIHGTTVAKATRALNLAAMPGEPQDTPEETVDFARRGVERLGRYADSDRDRVYARTALKAIDGAAELRPESAHQAYVTVLRVLASALPPNASVSAMLAVTAQGVKSQVPHCDQWVLGSSFLKSIAEIGGGADALVATRGLEHSQAGVGVPAIAHCFQDAAFETIANQDPTTQQPTNLNGAPPWLAEKVFYTRTADHMDRVRQSLQKELARREHQVPTDWLMPKKT